LLREIGDCDKELSHVELVDAVERTINQITALQKVSAIHRPAKKKGK
jgi:hypothetical protein